MGSAVVWCVALLFFVQLSFAIGDIYSPLVKGLRKSDVYLIAPPEHFIKTFQFFSSNVFRNVELAAGPIEPLEDVAIAAYLELLKGWIIGSAYGSVEKSVRPGFHPTTREYNSERRLNGFDWPLFGVSMVGMRRLENVQNLLFSVFSKNVPGDFVETGVWRGGTCIFARAVMRAKGQQHRKVYVSDSFAGLPPGNPVFGKGDMNWEKMDYLPTSPDQVALHFSMFNVLDSGVMFVQGYFNDSMPTLRSHLQRFDSSISILRLDGDMYQSTIDVIYRLYDLVSIGGYVIVDDWGLPARKACEDFFNHHDHHPTIVPIDRLSVYWMKHEAVNVRQELYEKRETLLKAF